MKDISSTSAENSLLKTGTMKEGKAKKGKSEIYAIIKKERELAKKSQRIQKFGFQQNNFLMSEKSSKRQNLRPMNLLKEIILALIKKTENKIKEVRDASTEKQARADAEKISKMGDLATQFTNSFEDILSEIRTREYIEQEQIYRGFLKLIEQAA